MPYDLTDPLQADEVRQKALAKGMSPSLVESSIQKATQQQFIQKRGYDSSGKVAGVEDAGGEQLGTTPVLGLTDIMASKETLRNLSTSIESRKGLLGPIKGSLNKLNPYATEAQDLQGEIDAARQLIGRSLEGGVLRKEDEEKYKKILPKLNDTPAVAQRKIENVYKLLEQKLKSSQVGLSGSGYDTSGFPNQPVGLGLEVDQTSSPGMLEEPMVKNTSNEIASVGDLVKDPNTGKLSIFGTVHDDPIFKIDKEFGFRVDNSVVRFLAENDYLSIGGSIVGGLMGGIPGGALGAGGGKAIERGLKELLNPEESNLTQHATAVLTEGLVDALFGGLTLGVGKIAGKGLGVILKKPGMEVAEAGARKAVGEVTEGISKEALEAGGKSLPGFASEEDLLRKAYKISKPAAKGFRDVYDIQPHQALLQNLDGDLRGLLESESAFDYFGDLQSSASKEITEKLGSRAVSSKKIVPDLENLIDGFRQNMIDPKTGKMISDFPQATKEGIKELEEKLAILKAEAANNGGYISLNKIQELKLSLNKAYKGQILQGSSKDVAARGRDLLMGKIEKYGGEGIRDSNMKYRLYDLFIDSAGSVDETVVKQGIDAMDLIAGLTGGVATGNVGVGVGTATFLKLLRNFSKNPEAQLKIVSKLGKYAVESENKNALRGLMLAVQQLGLPMSLEQTLVKNLGKETLIPDDEPGMSLQEDQGGGYPPGFLYK